MRRATTLDASCLAMELKHIQKLHASVATKRTRRAVLVAPTGDGCGTDDGPAAAETSHEKSASEIATQRELSGVIKSAKRVLELLDYFAECRRPLAVSDVVRGLGYPQSSASVLLKSLTKLGYLGYNRYTRLYMPTLRVALFGGWVSDELYTHINLSRLIDDLHQRSGGKTVMLGMQNGIYVQYVYVVQGNPEIPWYVKPGSLRPLARSGIGRMLLSRKSDVELQQLLWRINDQESDPALRMTVHELLREVNFARAHGYAYTEGTVNPLAGVVAVELPTPPSQPPMAVGFGCSIETLRHERESLLALLTETLQPYQTQRQAVATQSLERMPAREQGFPSVLRGMAHPSGDRTSVEAWPVRAGACP
jgi:DNA-binding IclR family transcriptional regulator